METGYQTNRSLYRAAFALSVFTIVYNLAEGAISTFFGYEDEALTLFGFGLDSFIETISALGVAHMIIRIRQNPNSSRDRFEITALKITGYSFYALCALLALMATMRVIDGKQPESTFWGIVVSSVSIAVMLLIIYWKTLLGKKLYSSPLVADANCAKVCVYMSIVLLISSFLYEQFGIPYVDIAGTGGLIYFSIKEGRECFDKAKGIATCNCSEVEGTPSCG
ncbi:MAG: cation transporter [Chitinophagales bacterium]|nr:cation transporter [Chitinophagales bacterium]